MANGGVKNVAKFFEPTSVDSTAAPPLRKPAVANKPKPFAKHDAASTGKESEETNPFKKFGAKNFVQDGGASAPAPKFRGGLNSTFPGKGLINDNSPDSNNNKNASSKEQDSKEDGPPKKALLPPKSPKTTQNAEGGEKPALKPKFPTPGSKPIVSEKPKPQTPAKVPLFPKPEPAKSDVNKTDSICSTSSNSSDSSISSSSPSANNFSKDKGQFDFSKKLRPVVLNGLPPKRTLNSVGSENTSDSRKSESDPSSPSPPPLTKAALPLPTSPSNSKLKHEGDQVFTALSKPNINLIEQLSKLKQRGKSIDKEEKTPVIVRESDGKKFRKITLEESAHSATAPEKPTLPTDIIDLSTLSKEYQKAMMQLKEPYSVTPSTTQEEKEPKAIEDIEEDEEIEYTISESMPCMPEMRPQKVEPAPSRASERISIIPDMSAEEEAAYDQTPADELYTVAESETPAKKEELGETEQERKRRKKEEEKERKDREKQEKEQEKQRKKKEEEKEKQRKKQEEEETKRRKNFKLTGNEQLVGEGEIKDDAKGGNLNLKVRKGQKVTIVRIDNNPANKWLVKTDTQMGYVDSTNISVDPDIIRQRKPRPMTLKEALLNPFTAGKNLIEAMTRDRKESALEEEDDQPTYDAVPEDTSGGGSTPAVEEEEYEDVYEEL